MASLIALAAMGLFAGGLIAGIVGVVSDGHPPGGEEPHPHY